MRSILLLATAVSVLACAGRRGERAPLSTVTADHVAVARAALTVLRSEASNEFVFAAVPGTVEFAAMAQLGPVRSAQLLSDSTYLVPPRLVRVDHIELYGDSARVAFVLGPVPRLAVLDCGKNYDIPLARQADGTWSITVFSVKMC